MCVYVYVCVCACVCEYVYICGYGYFQQSKQTQNIFWVIAFSTYKLT